MDDGMDVDEESEDGGVEPHGVTAWWVAPAASETNVDPAQTPQEICGYFQH